MFEEYNKCCDGCLSISASEERPASPSLKAAIEGPPAKSEKTGNVSLTSTDSAKMDGHAVDFKSDTNSSSNSKGFGKELCYGYGGCSNWAHVYDWGALCNGCSLQACVDACNRHSDCHYFGYGGHWNQVCYRLKGGCQIESSAHWQIMYKMVRVTGGWGQTHTISSKDEYEFESGWSSRVTTEVSRATQSSLETGFTLFGQGATGSVTASKSHMVSQTTTTDIQRHQLQKWKQTWTNKDGGYIWTWLWHVRPGTEPLLIITTSKRAQSDVSPNCLPEMQADRHYRTCKPGGWIAHNQPPPCIDQHLGCPTWKNYCEDPHYGHFMTTNCRKSCGKC